MIRQQGFTLMELLIGLTLLGLILTLLFSGLRLSSRSWDAGEEKVDRTGRIRAVENFLRQELSRIYPYRWKKADGSLAFQGEPRAIRFIGFLPGHAERGGLNVLGLEIEQQNGTWRMKLKHSPLDPEIQDFSILHGAGEVLLADGVRPEIVEDATFSYFGAETEQGTPVWMDHWSNPKRLPKLIRLRIRLSGGREWPDFVVSPMLSRDEQG